MDNVSGLIRGGQAVTLNAVNFVNQNTLGENQGLEGQRVALNTQTLDNQNGSLLASTDLTVQNNGVVNNSGGALASTGVLNLNGSSLNLINQGGTLKAGEKLTLNADALDGSGQILSLGDMDLHSAQGINNSGAMIANGNFTLTTPADITNSGKLLAGSALNVQSANLTNVASGEINAGTNTLTASGTVLNTGLIDGIRTVLTPTH